MRFNYSSISLLHDCGIAFYNRYVKNIQTPRSISATVGTAVDSAVNANLAFKIRTGELLPESELTDIVRGKVAEQFGRDEVVINPGDAGWMASREGALQAATGMALFHHEHAAPTIAPVAVQRYWELELEGYALNGYIDIAEADCVRDLKTSYRSPDKNAAHESKQLTMYGWALGKIDGAAPSKVALDYIVRTPVRGDMRLVQLVSNRTQSDVDDLDFWVMHAVNTAKRGSFRPAIEGHWMCQKKYCGYWESCPHGRKRQSSFGGGVSDTGEAA